MTHFSLVLKTMCRKQVVEAETGAVERWPLMISPSGFIPGVTGATEGIYTRVKKRAQLERLGAGHTKLLKYFVTT